VQHLGGWDHYGTLWERLLHQVTGLPLNREPEPVNQNG
jgi:hypothetical protein